MSINQKRPLDEIHNDDAPNTKRRRINNKNKNEKLLKQPLNQDGNHGENNSENKNNHNSIRDTQNERQEYTYSDNSRDASSSTSISSPHEQNTKTNRTIQFATTLSQPINEKHVYFNNNNQLRDTNNKSQYNTKYDTLKKAINNIKNEHKMLVETNNKLEMRLNKQKQNMWHIDNNNILSPCGILITIIILFCAILLKQIVALADTIVELQDTIVELQDTNVELNHKIVELQDTNVAIYIELNHKIMGLEIINNMELLYYKFYNTNGPDTFWRIYGNKIKINGGMVTFNGDADHYNTVYVYLSIMQTGIHKIKLKVLKKSSNCWIGIGITSTTNYKNDLCFGKNKDKYNYGYSSTGYKYSHDISSVSGVSKYEANDIIGIILDFNNLIVSFYKNNKKMYQINIKKYKYYFAISMGAQLRSSSGSIEIVSYSSDVY